MTDTSPYGRTGASNFLRQLLSRRAALAATLYLLYALLCTQLPLFNTLGYEFAALTGIVVSIVTLVLSPWSGADPDTQFTVRAYLSHVTAHTLLLLVPFAVLLVNASFVRNCALLTGALFFLLIPVPTVAFTGSLAWLVSLPGRRWRRALYAGVLVLLLLHPVLEILSQPQLYAYNHLFGYFVGFSWDELQPPIGTLLLYRLLTLSLALLLFSSSVIIYRRRVRAQLDAGGSGAFSAAAVFSFLAVIAGVLFSPSLGFRTTRGYLEEELGSRIRTVHFDMYFDSTGVDADGIRALAEEHEFRLSQVRSALGIGWDDRIRSYIYPSRAFKRRFLGTESSEIARPWTNEMHLSRDGWQSSLKHELVHVLAGSFAPYLFRAPVIRYLGLTEGLAMAVEWNWGNRTLHEYAAGMRRQGMLPGVRSFLTTRGFLNHASRLSYVASGSFCRWLIDRFGMEMFRQAYARDDLELIGAVDRLEREWHGFLDGVARSGPDSVAVRFLFGGEPIFRKVCARVLSDLNRDAASAGARNELDESLALYRRSEHLAPNARAVFGIVSIHFIREEYDSVLAVTGRYLADSLRSASLAPLLLPRGDAAWMTGDLESAKRCFTILRRENLYEELTRAVDIRLAILSSGANEARCRGIVTERSFSQARADSLRAGRVRRLMELVDSDSTFLPARYLLAGEVFSDSSDTMLFALLQWDSTGNDLVKRMAMMRADLLVRMREYDRARAEYRKLLELPLPEDQRNRIRDGIERCNWSGRYAPLPYDLQ